MKKTYTILLISFVLSLCGEKAYAQFVLAQDTIRGRIDFASRPNDTNNLVTIPNDSVFYMLPVDLSIDPWRQVYQYLPDRSVKKGYIESTKLMRVDDYDIVEVERLSAHGAIYFRNNAVRITMSVAPATSLNKGSDGVYRVNGKIARGVGSWGTPKLCYKAITVSINGRNIPVPKRIYEHLLEPDIENMVVYYNPQKETVYIHVNNGGNTAPYTALITVSIRGALSPYIFDQSMR